MTQRLSLSASLALCIALVLCVTCLGLYVFNRQVILAKFADIELREADINLKRAINTIASEQDRLLALVGDYADWDQTRQYMVDLNEAFPRENIGVNYLTTWHGNLMGIARPDGTILTGLAIDQNSQEMPELFDEVVQKLNRSSTTLQQIGTGTAKRDIVLTSCGPMLVVSKHVPFSQGSPISVGTFFAGRLLTDSLVEQFARQSAVTLSIKPADATPAAAIESTAGVLHSSVSTATTSTDIRSAATILDSQGQPALLVTVGTSRFVYRAGLATTRLTTAILILGSIATLILLWTVSTTLIVRPIGRLSSHLEAVGRTGDLNLKPPMTLRGDEIGTLANECERMMIQLRESQRRLADTSRAAGVAQIATGALHNIGNILNGITTAGSLLSTHLKGSKSGRLAQVVELVRANQSDLNRFFTQDPKGQKVLPYLEELAGQITAELARTTELAQRIEEETTQAVEIVRSQQAHARPINVTEVLHTSEIIRYATNIMQPSFERHQVDLVCENHVDLRFSTDRNKLCQILVNLLTNAKQAVACRPVGSRCIKLSALQRGAAIVFVVEDNGTGIAPEHLPQLFNQGFTTKPEGNGIGLHFCCLAAKELGGTVTASSDGPGRGATFVVQIPLTIPMMKAA